MSPATLPRPRRSTPCRSRCGCGAWLSASWSPGRADLFVSARRRAGAGLGEAALWTAGTSRWRWRSARLAATAGSAGGRPVLRRLADRIQPVARQPPGVHPADQPFRGAAAATQPGAAARDRARPAAARRAHRAGAAALHRFAWVLYLFGGSCYHRGPAGVPPPVRQAGSGAAACRRRSCRSRRGRRARLTTRVRGAATPLLMLVIAIAVTDLLFALDSIPAIFGLTRDPFLVSPPTCSRCSACGTCTS